MIKKIAFAGNSRFSKIVLEDLLKHKIKPSFIITSPEKKIIRGKVLSSSLIKDFATENSILIRDAKNKKEFTEVIKKENPDIVLVASFGIIISREALNLSTFVNVHPSLLPKYRGPTPIQTSILERCTENGISLILMNENIDEGPILVQKKINLDEKINYLNAEEQLAKEGALLSAETIPLLLSGKITPTIQDNKKATYTKIIKKEDGKINWNEPAEIIERKIRAFNPWPSVHGKIEGKYFKILEAGTQKQTNVGPFGKPGKIYLGTNNTIAVLTGKGFLLIKKLQIEGKKQTHSKDFLQGNMHLMGKILS